MDIGSYMDILKWTIELQMDYVRKENGISIDRNHGNYNDGIIRGLEIALEKIEASRFLAEK